MKAYIILTQILILVRSPIDPGRNYFDVIPAKLANLSHPFISVNNWFQLALTRATKFNTSRKRGIKFGNPSEGVEPGGGLGNREVPTVKEGERWEEPGGSAQSEASEDSPWGYQT